MRPSSETFPLITRRWIKWRPRSRNAFNAADKFGANMVTVTWDPVQQWFRVLSSNNVPIKEISDSPFSDSPNSLFNGNARLSFARTLVTDFDQLRELFPAASIQVSNPVAGDWAVLGKTRSFSITVDGVVHNRRA